MKSICWAVGLFLFHINVAWAIAPATAYADAVYLPAGQASTDTIDVDTVKTAPENWFNLDPKQNEVPGVSTEKTYKMLKNKPAKKVVVAVIDSGVDIEHEDLQGKIWTNSDEIAGNGKDDDNNGYVDDLHGWNFIGGADGQNVERDTYELTREYARLKKLHDGKDSTSLSKEDRAYYQQVKDAFETKLAQTQQEYAQFQYFYSSFQRSNKLLEAYLDVEEITPDTLAAVESPDQIVMAAKGFMENAFNLGLDEKGLKEADDYYSAGLDYGYNLEFDPRNIVGDNYTDINERYYGNNDVTGPDALHGTHVAGIIAANRHNSLGIEGIADSVVIMSIRAVPDGDERDKDIANAIYYAVDNGADIINMSFGKSYSPYKEAVDKAVEYAEDHNVLIVHAAGNSAEDIDIASNYPNRAFKDSKQQADNWIEVGASSWKGPGEFVAAFSNYGKRSVDVFAPGVDIYSTTPDQTYQSLSGTSMASPVTAGVAALLKSYYPHLTAEQLKDIILKSAVKKGKLEVNKPGAPGQTTKFSDLSNTGGVVNAYEAVKLADSYKIKRRK